MPRIAQVRARPLDVAMRKPFGIAGGAQEHARNVLVTLETDGGPTGLGEGAPFPAFNGETQEAVLASCARVELAGVDLEDTAEIRARLGDATPSTRCAIETAVVDARARVRRIPLHVMFGGSMTEIVTDVTITTGTIDDARREAASFAAFSTLKVKVGTNVEEDVTRVLAVRAARPDARLLVDANAGFTLDDALAFAAGVRAARVDLFEQPVRSWDDLAAFRARAGVRVAIDESVTCAADVAIAKARGAADAVNVKIMKSGIFEVLAILARAEEEGLDRMIGGMVETRLAMGTSACIAAGRGGLTIIDLDTPLFLAADPFAGGYAQDGERIDLAPIERGHGLRELRGALV
ncbi:MAG: dipeptide epimerase [Labilithrix sp.]|nr:dipeptide epimerase [Labilithrix sp.]MCW5816980.1 dipeptide epimerase [Labilithrix sp.]